MSNVNHLCLSLQYHFVSNLLSVLNFLIGKWLSDYIWYNSIKPCWIIHINTLRMRQNGRHFAHNIFKRILLNENVWIRIKNSLKFVPQGPINNIPALVQTMAWSRPGDKPLSEPMLVSLPMYICVTRPQWVNTLRPKHYITSVHLMKYVWVIKNDILVDLLEI